MDTLETDNTNFTEIFGSLEEPGPKTDEESPEALRYFFESAPFLWEGVSENVKVGMEALEENPISAAMMNDARAMIENGERFVPSTADCDRMIEAGWRALREEDLGEAYGIFAIAQLLRPEQSSAYIGSFMVVAALEGYEHACAFFESMLWMFDEDASFLLAMGLCHLRAGKSATAEVALESALDIASRAQTTELEELAQKAEELLDELREAHKAPSEAEAV